LRGRNATGDVAIDHLVLSDGRKVERIRTRFSLADGKLDAPQVQAAGYGGRSRARSRSMREPSRRRLR
jgi:hypothetical protein